jgi:hypothetical protein
MRSSRLGFVLLTVGLTCSPTAAFGAQALYAAAGVGPTPVLEGRSGNRNWFGTVGYQGRGALGARLSGSETASRLWLAADLVYQPGAALRALRPYALVGAGMVLDLSETDPLLTAGAGFRAQLQRLIFVFAEVRLYTIPGSPTAGPRTILPITVGLGLGK